MVRKGQAKLDEFAFVLIAGLIIIIVMLFAWGVPSSREIPTVIPSSKSLVIERGEAESFLIEINVTSKAVTLTPKGTIKDWIHFSDNNFEAWGLSNVEVTIDVPLNTEERDHLGTIVIESMEGGEVDIPLTITVVDITETKPARVSRPIYIGDFTVSFAKGTEVVKTEENIEVRKNLNEDKKVSMSGIIERDIDLVTDGSISIDVLYTNREGNLVVKFNNQVVFNKKAMPGEIVIPISKTLLNRYNVIQISTTGPGWKFWSKSVYEIDKVEFSINFFGDLGTEETFNVYRDEIINFKEGRLEFYVESYEGPGSLTVEINGYPIYQGRQRGRFVRNFDYVDVGLVRGPNTISFSTERDTTYEIENIRIILVHEEPE